MLCHVVLRTMRILLRLRLLHVVDVYYTMSSVREQETSLHLVGRRHLWHVKVTGRSRIFESGRLRRLPSLSGIEALKELSRPGTLHIAFEMPTRSHR